MVIKSRKVKWKERREWRKNEKYYKKITLSGKMEGKKERKRKNKEQKDRKKEQKKKKSRRRKVKKNEQ